MGTNVVVYCATYMSQLEAEKQWENTATELPSRESAHLRRPCELKE